MTDYLKKSYRDGQDGKTFRSTGDINQDIVERRAYDKGKSQAQLDAQMRNQTAAYWSRNDTTSVVHSGPSRYGLSWIIGRLISLAFTTICALPVAFYWSVFIIYLVIFFTGRPYEELLSGWTGQANMTFSDALFLTASLIALLALIGVHFAKKRFWIIAATFLAMPLAGSLYTIFSPALVEALDPDQTTPRQTGLISAAMMLPYLFRLVWARTKGK